MKKTSIFLCCLVALFACTLHAQSQKIRVSCIGNSITFGTGVPNPDTDSYPAQLQQLLGDQYEVARFGLPGATLINRAFRPYMAGKEFQQAMAWPCDIAVIHLGVNDTDPRSWPNYREDFVKDYLSLIDSVRSRNPKCRIIIAKIAPQRNTHHRFQSGTRDWNLQIREAIETVAAAANCDLIDFYTPLHRHPELLHDTVHPNTEGCLILAQTAYSAITGNYGGLQLASGFSSGMVLPRNRQLPLCGIANVGDVVTVTIAGQKHTATTGLDGEWKVTLNPLKTGGPYKLTVSTKRQKIELTDILAGEVWLCSGQSNMAFSLKECATGAADIPVSANSQIRLLNYQWTVPTYDLVFSPEQLENINHLKYMDRPSWTTCTPETAAAFSAVGYYFAQALQDSLQVPVGIIQNAVGGSGIEAWIDRTTMENELPNILTDWVNNDFIQDWARGRAKKNMGENRTPFQRHPFEPCYMYEENIETNLSKVPICGVLWYQGESNAHCVESHEQMFDMLVRSWRNTWKNPDLPFYYVQLSSIERPSWPWFRDSQRRLLTCQPHLGMAVSSDLGDPSDVHYKEKKPLGERLVRWALSQDYGHKNLVPSGPLFQSAKRVGSKIEVTFQYGEGLHAANGTPIQGFEIATFDGLYKPATAVVMGNTIQVSCPEIKDPHYVRYAFEPYTRANLVNGENLPASTFFTGRVE